MLTKTPDYMISECGCPELWSSDSKHLPLTKLNSKFWNSYSSWCSNKSTQFSKLLPLRESWTDYYTKNLMKQNEESNKYSKLTPNQKQQKNQNNEVTKKRSFQFNSSKRRIDAGSMDSHQYRSQVKNLDNDIDQF